MTKSIKLWTIAFACGVFLILAFKSSDNEKKEYVTIYYNDVHKAVALSYSNGTYKTVEFQKQQGDGDQTQLLKLINEHEAMGFKLITYDYKPTFNTTNKQVTSVLLSK